MTQTQFVEAVIRALARTLLAESPGARPAPPPPAAVPPTPQAEARPELDAFLRAAQAYARGEPSPPGFYIADSSAENAPETLPWVAP